MDKIYIAIDLKSFYASVECMERQLDPMTTNLVVADSSRTEKTICLAVTPTLKAYGLSGRSRLFEVVQRIKEANNKRMRAGKNTLIGSSVDDNELKNDPNLLIDYIIARPQMAKYIEISTQIYEVYLKYIAPEDMHVYSIDEVFIDATNYLFTYKTDAIGLAKTIIADVYETTGITSVAGVGTNLYLCKVAMDIMAKRTVADENGFRVAYLDEMLYKKQLWEHRPITDFWRVGKGYKKRLEDQRLYTMGDIARCSLGGERDYYNEELLYRLFGVNAELLIDHAWGYEPCTIADIKAYKPQTNSISSGQVLQEPYPCDKARLVTREMTELLVLDLVEKRMVTDQLVLTIGYDTTGVTDDYIGEVKIDSYGRKIPKHSHGTQNLNSHTSSTTVIVGEMMDLYDRIVNPELSIRRLTVVAGRVLPENEVAQEEFEQLDLFASTPQKEPKQDDESLEKERSRQLAILKIQNKYGKNAILKGTNLEEGATAMERNSTIGGHKA